MKSSAIHKQLHAFTLLELLVGMILSGIVLTATFSACRIITRQYESYRNKSQSDCEISFFVSQLQSDFSTAESISLVGENEIEMKSQKKNLDYFFSEKNVLRNDFSRTDTFHVSVLSVETFLKTEKTGSENSPIDELHLLLDVYGKKEEKIYLKTGNTKSEIDDAEKQMNGNGN